MRLKLVSSYSFIPFLYMYDDHSEGRDGSAGTRDGCQLLSVLSDH
jgi:hypothetical protein